MSTPPEGPAAPWDARPYSDADIAWGAQFIAGHPDAAVDERHFAATRAVLDAFASAGRLLAPEKSVMIECRIDWVDLCGECPGRTKRQDYDWERAAFEGGLAREVMAAVRFDWQPARIRTRIVSTRVDGSRNITAWSEVLG